MTDAEEAIVDATLGLAVPALAAWIRSKVLGGSSAQQTAADLEALFAAADIVIDAAEDAKFGPRPASGGISAFERESKTKP